MICFAWAGFPQYAARCIREVVKRSEERIVVIGGRPRVPIKGMEGLCGCKVIWVNYEDKVTLKELLGGELPRVLFMTGWSVKLFQSFRDEVKANGGGVVCLVDNNFKLNNFSISSFHCWNDLFREIAKAIRFRLGICKRYDAFLVPGESGTKLMSFYGARGNRVREGMYAADDSLFTSETPITERPKKIIYVGQYIERKNVLRLIEAFSRAALSLKAGYFLEMYGSGILKDRLVRRAEELNEALGRVGSYIRVNDFVQPEELAPLYHTARVFCLPSYEDHWGLVVHEAALSGCFLLLSQYVGAAEDFLVAKENGDGYINGGMFDPYSTKAMVKAFKHVMQIDDADAERAQSEGLRAAQSTSTRKFAQAILDLAKTNSAYAKNQAVKGQ